MGAMDDGSVFPVMGLETSVVYRFDTGPTFIDTDGPTCHPPECHHNQGVNLSSVIFAIFSVRDGFESFEVGRLVENSGEFEASHVVLHRPRSARTKFGLFGFFF